jgi:hypothetical protein
LPAKISPPADDVNATTKKQYTDYETVIEKHIEATDLITPMISGTVKRKLILADFDNINRMMTHLQEIYNPRSEQIFMQLIQQLFTL